MVVGNNGIQVSQRKRNLAAVWVIIQGWINGVWTEDQEEMRDFLKQWSVRIDGWLKKGVEEENIRVESDFLRFWVGVTLGEWQDLSCEKELVCRDGDDLVLGLFNFKWW